MASVMAAALAFNGGLIPTTVSSGIASVFAMGSVFQLGEAVTSFAQVPASGDTIQYWLRARGFPGPPRWIAFSGLLVLGLFSAVVLYLTPHAAA